MERRKFVIGMGSLAAGGAAAMGTGAFSYARAERDITVETSGDASAYLGLEETSAYASGTDGGQLALDFSGAYEAQNGDGLNENADTRFDNVFKIKNNGTNNVSIAFHDTEGEAVYDSPAATWYYSRSEGYEGNEVNKDNPVVEPGDEIYVHVVFWMTEYEEGDLPDHLGIVADGA